MIAEFLTTDDPRWPAALNRLPHDFYHLPAYVALEAEWSDAFPLAFLYAEGDTAMLLVLQERVTPSGHARDVVTPYGYSCPLFSEDADDNFRLRALRTYQRAARERGIVTSFIRLHPLLTAGLTDLDEIGVGKWVQNDRGVTLTMPMTGDDATFMAGMARGHRAGVRKLREAGGHLVLDTPEVWTAFPEIYRHTMRKVAASSDYFYSDAYVECFQRDLIDHAHCAGIASPTGEIMCAGLFTRVGTILQYHLSGTAEGFARQAPMKLLLADMRRWAFEQGIVHFHLGGGLGAKRDSLYEFKQQFGGAEWPFRTVSVIHDAGAYATECAWRAEKAGGVVPPDTGFFPLYRSPLPEGAEA